MFSECTPDINVTGLEKILNAKNSATQRLIWAVLVLAATGFLGYHAHDRISHYLSYPKAVNIEEIPQQKLNFPAVTIGNENWIPNRNYTNSSAFVRRMFGLLLNHITNATFEKDEMKEFLEPKFFFSISHKLDDMLQSCRFGGKPCGASDFEPIVTDYGPGYRFNSDGQGEVKVFGKSSGLRMLIDVETADYLRNRHETEGIKITLTKAGDQPFVMMNAIVVEPGKITDIIIRQTRTEYLPPLCTYNPPKLQHFSIYTQQNCLAECMFDFTYRDPVPEPPKCKCYLQMYHLHAGKKAHDLCNTNNYQQCHMKMLRHAPEECIPKCPRACRQTVYSSQVQTTNMIEGVYYTNFHLKEWNKKIDWPYFKRNMAYVRIYYQDLTYTDIRQYYAYSLLTLLSDLGGCLGLFLGACMLTVLQILDFVMALLVGHMKKRARNKVNVRPKA